MIEEFFIDYIELYQADGGDLKPKAHYIRHYPILINKFGPLFKTLRFESKNGQMKTFLNNNKNRKNICFSLAKKHQMLMYLTYKKKFMLEHEVRMIGSFETSLECLPNSERILIENTVNVQDDRMFIQGKAVCYEGHRYSTGEVVVLAFLEDEYVFGKIMKSFIIDSVVYLMCNVLVTNHFSSHLHAYAVEESDTGRFVRINDLLDYHPLALYMIDSKFYTVMRYHIPVDY